MTAKPDDAGSADLSTFWKALVACGHHLPSLLRVVAQQVVDVVGEGCVLTTVTDDGAHLRPQVILHTDPAMTRAMEEAVASGDIRIGEGLAGTVAKDRRPIVANDIAPAAIAEATAARFRSFAREHPMRSLAIVPMVAGTQLVGTLGAVRTTSADPYTPADVRVLESLAERAALAIAQATATPRAIGPSDYEAIFLHSLDGVLLTTPDGHILAANPMACTLLGLTEREIVDRGREGVLVAEDPRLGPALAERASAGRARAELTMRRGDGSTFVADVSSTIFTTYDGRPRAVVIFRDMSDVVAARELARDQVARLEQAANRDDLTGLLNRRGFAVAAEQALAGADRTGTTTLLLFVDLNEMKRLNDTHGHSGGDAALVAVAAALDSATRDADVVCRLGGDEFVALLGDTDRSELPAIVERIDEALAADGQAPPGVTVSTGVVERPPGARLSLTELIDAADREMYQHKVLRRLSRAEDLGGVGGEVDGEAS